MNNVFPSTPRLFLEPRFATSGDIRIAYYALGEGPAVIFCHGFPELGFMWRKILPIVAAAGYCAVAVDMRGYGNSDAPKESEAYTIRHLTADLAGLLDHLDVEKAAFVGHDWGASVVWEMATFHPSRVSAVAGVNTPRWKYRKWGDRPFEWIAENFGPEHYMLRFREEGIADNALLENVEGGFARRFCRPALDKVDELTRPDLVNQHSTALATMPVGENCLTSDEMLFYVNMFKRTGFTGGLNYYRNLERNAALLRGSPVELPVPSLMVAATHDIFNPLEASEGIESIGNPCERVVFENVSHWIPEEAPERLAHTLVGWSGRWYPI